MAQPSYASLRTPVTREQQLATLLQLAAGARFPVTTWREGDVGLTLLQIDAEVLAEVANVVRLTAQGGFLDDAEDDWLTVLASGVFDLVRQPALKTQGDAVLSDPESAGPYTIVVGQLRASDPNGIEFVNTQGGVLPAGGMLTLAFEAAVAGAGGNIPGGTLRTLVTPLPGVSIDNPDGGDTWVTRAGADQESDPQLRTRCRARWATLGTGATADTYRFWALTASTEVRRVRVLEHSNLGVPTDGHVTLYLAGDSGPVSPQAVTDVVAYIAPRRPLTVTVHVASAVANNVALTGNVLVDAASLVSAPAAVAANYAALGQALDIGAVVYSAELIEQIMTPVGVRNVALSAPAADVVLAANEVATFDLGGLAYVTS